MNEYLYDLTVIVPVYNTEHYLKRCIDSLVNQSEKKIEIVLVDDGSNDQSGSICDNYSEKYRNVITIHKKNEGQGLARNDGLRVASGRYICFLDSDDYYDRRTCEKLIRTMEEHNADICSYGYQIDDNNGNCIRVPRMNNKIYEGKNEVDNFILHYFGDSIHDDTLRGVSACMSVFKKNIISENQIKFPSERVVSSEDTAFCLEYCKHINKAVTISNVLYHYCLNGTSFSQGYRDDRLKLMAAHLEMLNSFADQYKIYDKVKDRIAMTAWINLIAYYKQVYRKFERRKAIELFKDSAENDVIKDELAQICRKELPIQQRILFETIIKRMYVLSYLIVGIRIRKVL